MFVNTNSILKELIESYSKPRNWNEEDICSSKNTDPVSKKWNSIRAMYAEFDPHSGYEPYLIDWSRVFTAIEMDAWCSIRFYGVPLYPQYPIDKFFVDFADPIKKIVLECDGREWHNETKDKERDTILHFLGWKVFRITGAECYRKIRDICSIDEDINEERITEYQARIEYYDWATRTSDGVIAAISWKYYGRKFPELISDALDRSLEFHESTRRFRNG